MANFPLTAGDDDLTGTDDADVFSGELGGTDHLYGLGGADRFEIDRGTGLIDGGTGLDLVSAAGDLGDWQFASVELLELQNNLVGSLTQLSSFSTISNRDPNDSTLVVWLEGQGGTLDLSARLAPGLTATVDATSLQSGLSLKAGNIDHFSGTQFDDHIFGLTESATLDTGFGDDILEGSEEADWFLSGAGDDVIYGNGGTIRSRAKMDQTPSSVEWGTTSCTSSRARKRPWTQERTTTKFSSMAVVLERWTADAASTRPSSWKLPPST